MKLKNGFILHDVGDEHLVVATEDALKTFHGMIRNNASANFIFQQLQRDTTEEKIVTAMLEKYDAPKEVIASDVHRVIAQIRKAGLLDEG